jgi:hypothetical protein
MSAEHLILAGIFAFLFIAPLVWLFVFDGQRSLEPDLKFEPADDDRSVVPPINGA